MNNVQGLLGLAKRARKIASGEILLKEFQADRVRLLILSEDIGENSKKKMLNKCSYYHVPYVYMDDASLNQAIGERNKKAIAILDEGFAQKLMTCLKG